MPKPLETQIGSHPHVVALCREFHAELPKIGWPCSFWEYCQYGNLQDTVAAESLSMEERLRHLVEVSKGMEHIAGRSVVHRNLTIQNMLVAQVGSNRVAKVRIQF